MRHITVEKVIQGDWPWHANRVITDPRSEWHNVRGKRTEAMLFGDNHVEFYKFPADLANHINDLPDPNYLFWQSATFQRPHWRAQPRAFNQPRVLLFHSVEVRPGAEEERLACDRWRSHEADFELVLSQLLKLAVRGNYRGLSFLAEEVDASVGGQWRGRIVSADAFIPDNRAGLGLPAGGDPVVVYGEEQIADQQQRRFLGRVAFGFPHNLQLRGRRSGRICINHLPFSPRTNRQHLPD